MSSSNSSEYSKFLDRLNSDVDIVSTISRYVHLTQRGKNYVCCCPFHNEKTPSFSINSIGQYFHCFGCGESGNAITFVMKYENCDFTKAVEILAKQNNMEVPTRSANENYKQIKDEKDQILECLKEAAKFYFNELHKETGKPARDYLLSRRITEKSIRSFGIGYAKDWNSLIKHLASKNFRKEILIKAGICEDNGKGAYDPLGERIIFPILNLFGEVVGFSGRTLKSNFEGAKYKNTKETLVFKKSNELFGLSLVKKHSKTEKVNRIILVEGQIDVIPLYEQGVKNVVATLGTAFSQIHAKQIKRFCNNLVVCFDGDKAGENASFKALEVLHNSGLNVKVLSLDDGKDPDEFVKEFGGEAFLKLLDGALNVMDYYLSKLSKKYNLNEKQEVIKFAEEALKRLSENCDELEFEVYLKTIEDITKISKEVLRNNLNKNIQLNALEEVNNNVRQDTKELDAQRFILNSILNQKKYAMVSENKWFKFNKEYEALYQFFKKEECKLSDLFIRWNGDKKILDEVLNVNTSFEDDKIEKKYYNDCVNFICEQNIKQKIEDLKGQQKLAILNEDKLNIMREIQELTEEVRRIRENE